MNLELDPAECWVVTDALKDWLTVPEHRGSTMAAPAVSILTKIANGATHADDFDYAAAWHILVGWINSMADEDRRLPMPAHMREDLAAGYVFAVQRGMPGEALDAA